MISMLEEPVISKYLFRWDFVPHPQKLSTGITMAANVMDRRKGTCLLIYACEVLDVDA